MGDRTDLDALATVTGQTRAGTRPAATVPPGATGPGRPAAAVPARRPSGRLLRWYWLWPALLMGGAGTAGLGTPALWADELATWGAVRLGWGPLLRLLGTVDAVVGPYYLLLKAWTLVAGTSTVALRLPSLAAMCGAAALVAVLAARLVDPARAAWTGLLAGGLFVAVPTASRYAQEARPYALVILAVVAATLVLTRLLDSPGPAAVLGYAGCVTAVGLFHLVGMLIVAAHAVPVGYRLRTGPRGAPARRLARAFLLAAGAGSAVPAVLAWYGQRQDAQIAWIPRAGVRALLGSPEIILTAGTAAGAVLLLAVLAVRVDRAGALLAGWALVPVLLLWLAGHAVPLYWPRYLTYTMPAAVLLAAFTLARLRRAVALAALAAVALLALPTQLAVRAGDGHNHATAAAAAIVGRGDRPGDGIVYDLDEQPEPWEGRDIVARYVPAGRTPRDVFAVRPQRTGGRLVATECADLAACLDAADPPRLWTIRFGNTTDPLAGIGPAKEPLLRARYRVMQVWLLRGLTVALLVRS